MLIQQLFSPERNPTRALNEVVNAEDQLDVRGEVDEYVFTENTTQALRDLMEGLLDSSSGAQPDCTRTWIAGFFGSGKSHFLKLSARLLANEIVSTAEGERPLLQYCVERHKLNLPWERLAHEFKVGSVVVNLALAVGGGTKAQEKPLLFRLMSELCRLRNESAIPHVALLEREIKKAKKWDAFLEAVKAFSAQHHDVDIAGQPLGWNSLEIRDKASDAHNVLVQVLPTILPKYPNDRAVRAYLDTAEKDDPSAEAVVRLALQTAEDMHPEMGRVILGVDEVALYLVGNPDRVREVQGLAETVERKGKGRVFLWVTAQQRVDTIDQHFASVDGRIGFLRDRFPGGARITLEERDIDTVVRERWLRKRADSPAFATLRQLMTAHGGHLARSARLHEENLLKETRPLTDEAAVLAYYPCLPYHVRLIQSILTALRSSRQVDQTAAQSRALLTSIRTLFLPQNGANLANAEVGTLVTFDRVYDVIRESVRKRDSATDQWITETIEKSMGDCDGIKVSAVAKVIFLLQNLNAEGARRIKVDAENVAALLYPRLGAVWEPHFKAVRDACQKLVSEHFVGEDPELGYRFFSQEQKTFQQEVDAEPVVDGEVYGALRKAIDDKVKELGLSTVTAAAGVRLPVQVHVHVGATTPSLPGADAEARAIELHVIWPWVGAPAALPRIWAAKYAHTPHVVLLYATGASQADEMIRRVQKLDAAVRRYTQRHGAGSTKFLSDEVTRAQTLRDESIPAQVERALLSGLMIHQGVDSALASGTTGAVDVTKEALKQAVGQVFTDLDIGVATLDDAGLKKVFSWKPPQTQPDFFGKLQLFDAGGHPLVDRPFLREIQAALKGKPESERTGSKLKERFESAPYGWPERSLKAGLAALLRSRRIVVRLKEGAVLRAPDGQDRDRAEAWLTGTQIFGPAVLELSDLSLSQAEREQLTRLFDQAFQAPGLDTLEKLERWAREQLPSWLGLARETHEAVNGRQMPGASRLKVLVQWLEAAAEIDLEVGKLKQVLAGLTDLHAEPAQRVDVAVGLLDLHRAVSRVRQQGKLDSLHGLRQRAVNVYPEWRSCATGPDVKKALDGIMNRAGSENLYAEADQAVSDEHVVFGAYAEHYQQRHAALYDEVQQGLAALHAHAFWSQVPVHDQADLEADLAKDNCADAVHLAYAADATGRCPSCRLGFTALETARELAGHRRNAALKKLDMLAKPKKVEVVEASPTFTLEVASAADLPLLLDRIRTVAQQALAKPRRVTVTFDPKKD